MTREEAFKVLDELADWSEEAPSEELIALTLSEDPGFPAAPPDPNRVPHPKVGVSQPQVIQVQNAGETLNLTTLVKFAGALGYRLRLEFVPEEGGESLKTL